MASQSTGSMNKVELLQILKIHLFNTNATICSMSFFQVATMQNSKL